MLHRNPMLVLPAFLVAVAATAATLTPQQIGWYRSQLGLSAISPVQMGTSATGYTYAPPAAGTAGVQSDPIAEALVAWRRLRQSDRLLFQDYSAFLLAHPGWPGEAQMRRAAEGAIQPDAVPPDQVVSFLTRFPPTTGGGRTRLAEALFALGRPAEAQVAARAAWTGGNLSSDDETRLLGRFGGGFTQADQDERMERLLWDRAFVAAQRQITAVSAARRPVYAARLAYQIKSPDAYQQAATLAGSADHDAGYVYDRVNWLRETAQEVQARTELAQPRTLDAPPYDVVKWLNLRLTFARSAAADQQWALAYGIASQLASAFPAGASVRATAFATRDPYTSLAWLAGQAALLHLNRPADAVAMFRAYGDGSLSPQTRAKGYYWAGRAALAAGDATGANGYFQNAAAYPDKFYGQLALERLGRPVPAPAEPNFAAIAEADRTTFDSREIVRAARILGQLGDWQDQSQFLRVIASGAAISDSDHLLAASLARELYRPDLGVMAARAAKPEDASDYVRSGFPVLPVPADIANSFSFIHGIMRQESQFDRQAVSGAGARGMMQLMPATAREQAGKMGLPYDYLRLTSDPGYNMQLGTGYFGRTMDMFGGNYVLAIAAYNAGAGNVRRWIAQNGDPRSGGVDVLNWIEAIPFSETRGYVENVLENVVVYDTLNPARAGQPQVNRLSYYLGKGNPG
jgi:soluble lytic murein transglycosylase